MKKLICLIVMIVIAESAGAANVLWDAGGSDTDWLTPENWVGNVAPTSADLPIINGNYTVTIANDVLVNYYSRIIIDNVDAVINHTAGSLGNASAIYYLDFWLGTYNLNGGTIAINGNIRIREGGGDSTLNVNSGSLTLQANRSIILGPIDNWNVVKKLKISGGTVTISGTGNIVLDGEAGANQGCSQILQIIGNSASISIGQDLILGSTGAEIAPELNLEFAVGGITPIDVGGDFSILQGGAPSAAKLVVDVVDLGSVSQTTYDLIPYGGALAGIFGSVSVTDWNGTMIAGTWNSLGHHEYAISYGDGSADIVQLQVNTTPEPAFLGLLGLGVLAFIRRR